MKRNLIFRCFGRAAPKKLAAGKDRHIKTMQDLSTGELKDLTQFLKEIPVKTSPFEKRRALDEACAKAQPDPALRGPVFEVGEILEIRGGRFQITRIEPGHMRLKGLPSK